MQLLTFLSSKSKIMKLVPLDRVIATNFWSIILLGGAVTLFYFNHFESAIARGSIYFVICVLIIFNFRIASKLYQRKRVYDIIIGRLYTEGFNKEVFTGRCSTICAFTICLYIVLRHLKFKLIPYIFEQFISGRSYALHPDKEIEKAINKFVFNE